MSRKRDIIQEIEEIRRRGRHTAARYEIGRRLVELEHAFHQHDRSNKELVKYFPVAIVACIEAYFRMAIKDLVDSGDPFIGRAENLPSLLKPDFSILIAIHGKAITMGEFIAHGIQLSRLEHIEQAISIFLETSFLGAIKITTNRWASEIRGEPSVPILAKPDEVFGDVVKTFELRHIVCHEIASAYEIDHEEVERCFRNCVTFLRAANELISETIHPGAPLTQTAMNTAADESLMEAKGLLYKACESVRSRLNQRELLAFDESQEKWQSYCDAWALFVAGERSMGGTIWPVIYAGAAHATIDRRLEEVGKWKRLSDPA